MSNAFKKTEKGITRLVNEANEHYFKNGLTTVDMMPENVIRAMEWHGIIDRQQGTQAKNPEWETEEPRYNYGFIVPHNSQ